jgi:hypothetical protein
VGSIPTPRAFYSMKNMKELGSVEFNTEVKKVIQEQAPLRKDIVPATVQILDWRDDHDNLEDIREGIKDDVNYVDFDNGNLDVLGERGFKHDGFRSYLISPIGEENWYSDHYFNCTAVVAMGKDIKSGEEISFLSHQDPVYFIDGGDEKTEKFSQDLSGLLKELEFRSEKDTIEVFLLGGNYNSNPDKKKGEYEHRHYKESIIKLEQIVQDSLGFDPKVLAGPNNHVGSETIVTVETQKRKVWIERGKQPADFDESFQASKFEEQEKKWLAADSKK